MIYKCPKCNSEFRADIVGIVFCPSCNEKVRVGKGLSNGTAWDRAGGGSFVNAFIETVKKSIFNPMEYFEEVRLGQGYIRPLIFATIISILVFIAAAAYQAGFQALAIGMDVASKVKGVFSPFLAISAPFTVLFLAGAVLIGVPLFTVAVTFIQAAVCHLCLTIVGAGERGYWGTFRTMCYASGPQVFQLFPVFGGFIGPMWQLAITVIGFRVVHNTSYSRSAVAVFLPVMVCCGVVFLVLIAIAGGAVGSLIKGGA